METSAAKGSRQASQVLMREMRQLLSLQGESERPLEVEMVKEGRREV